MSLNTPLFCGLLRTGRGWVEPDPFAWCASLRSAASLLRLVLAPLVSLRSSARGWGPPLGGVRKPYFETIRNASKSSNQLPIFLTQVSPIFCTRSLPIANTVLYRAVGDSSIRFRRVHGLACPRSANSTLRPQLVFIRHISAKLATNDAKQSMNVCCLCMFMYKYMHRYLWAFLGTGINYGM